jgi:hypothetical protein
MPTPSHSPEWHLLDSRFADANRGLVPPARNLSAGGAALRIENLDRADPPGYQPGDVPRGKFNANVFSLTAAPAMPRIPVVCSVTGFDPAQTPIEWRLVCRHVLCRHTNVTRFRYSGASESFEREWRGRSASARFELFDGPCSYSDAGRVLGGHALLMAAVALPQARLLDYVHVRIAGANPTPAEVLGHLDARLAGYDPNIVRMARAVFSQESNFRQFAAGAQSSALMKFTRVHHADAAQPDCAVRFDWPDDPPGFPLASFDFGVGISQWTRVGQQRVSADIAWDWRENIRLGVNLLLGAVGRALKPGRSWREVARVAWTAYNGTGAAAAAYAARLAASPDGRAISTAPAPSAAKAQVALLAAPAPLPEPEPWAYA